MYTYIYCMYIHICVCVRVLMCMCIYIMYIYAPPTACSSDWHRFFLAIRALCKRQSSATSKTHTGSILFKETQRGMTYPSFHAPLTGSQFYRILWQLECGDGIGGANWLQLKLAGPYPGRFWQCGHAAIGLLKLKHPVVRHFCRHW